MVLRIAIASSLACTLIVQVSAQTFTTTGVPEAAKLTVESPNSKVTTTAFEPIELKTISAALLDDLKVFDKANDETWKAVMAGTAFTGNINVAQYSPFAGNDTYGGLEAEFTYTPAARGGAGSPTPLSGTMPVNPSTSNAISNATNIAGKAIWIQGVSRSRPYKGLGLLGMDAITGKPAADQFSGPFYGYQYKSSGFWDRPEKPANVWTYFQAYLAVPDFTTDTLTIYDGVQWGFQVTKDGFGGWGDNPPRILTAPPAPGPAPFMPFAVGLVGLARRRRRTALSRIAGTPNPHVESGK